MPRCTLGPGAFEVVLTKMRFVIYLIMIITITIRGSDPVFRERWSY
jgi:hypothetical protein